MIGGVIGTTTGTLTKDGTGTLVLSGTNTYTGITTVSAGVVRVQNSTSLGTVAGGTTVASGAAIEIDGSGLAIAEPISSLIGTGIASAGALRNLANSNTWSGALTLGALGARVNSDAGTLTLGAISGAGQPLTVGGAGNTSVGGIIGTTTGSLTKDGAGTLTLSGLNTYTGATTINGGTVSIAADNNLGTAPGAPTPTQLTFSVGTLQVTATFTLNANRGIALTGNAMLDVAANRTLTYAGTATGSGGLTKTGDGVLSMTGATLAVGNFTVSAGTVAGPTATTFAVAGDWTNTASAAAYTPGAGTLTLNGGSGQAVGGAFATAFGGLTIADASGITLSADVTVTGLLSLTSGIVSTGSKAFSIGAAGSVSRTSGWVNGAFTKAIVTGATSRTFEVGDATTYTPATLAFASVSVAGNVTVRSTAGDHPALASSFIDPGQGANRYWTLTGSGITFTTYDATFTFVAGDLDGGADTSLFSVERYALGTWSPLGTGSRTSVSTQATGVGDFGDFCAGEDLNTAPNASDDSYATTQDNPLVVAAPGVLANDSDPQGHPIAVANPRPISGPSHGSLALNTDGSFTCTPVAGFSGADSFTYAATDADLTSSAATLTITIRDHALISGSGWPTAFYASRSLDFAFPAYVPSGAVVTNATFRYAYRSLDGVGTTCYYFEVYDGATLLGTHGSPASPVSCNGTGSYATDATSLPEIASVAEANNVTVRVYLRNSAGAQSQTSLATLGVDSYLP